MHSVALTLQKQRSPAEERQQMLLPCGVHFATAVPVGLPLPHSQSVAPFVVVVVQANEVQEHAPLPFARYASSPQQIAGEPPTEVVEQGSVRLPFCSGVQSHLPGDSMHPSVGRGPLGAPPSVVEEEEDEEQAMAMNTATPAIGREASEATGGSRMGIVLPLGKSLSPGNGRTVEAGAA
jgi:hypothetical protein